MRTHFSLDKNQTELNNIQSRVKVTDLLSRLNEEKKIEKKKKSGPWSCRCLCSYSFWHNSYNLIYNL